MLLLLSIAIVQLVALSITSLAAVSVPKEVTFYEFGESTCPHCTALLNLFANNFPNNTLFCDIATSQSCLNRFSNWLGFSSFPGSVPQTFVIYNKTYILGIVIGEVDNATFWANIALSQPNEARFPVYAGDQLWGYVNGSVVAQQYIINTFLYPSANNTNTSTITQPSTNQTQSGGGMSYKSFITSLASLAITDAVNICVISIYTLLLASIATRSSKRRAALSGLLFTLGVFSGYMILGLGLLKLIAALGGLPTLIIRYLLAVYGVILIVSSVYSYVKSKTCKTCKEEGILGKLFSAGKWIEKSPPLHYLFGLAISIALIPCSAGPYLVFLVMLSSITGIAKMLYLLVYVLIFVAPLLIFLEVVVLTMKAVPESKVKLVRSIIVPLAGILLIIVSLGLF